MAPDGKVVVEARYQKVEIEGDGTVRLTVIPGKVPQSRMITNNRCFSRVIDNL